MNFVLLFVAFVHWICCLFDAPFRNSQFILFYFCANLFYLKWLQQWNGTDQVLCTYTISYIESLGIFFASGDTFTLFNTWQIIWYANLKKKNQFVQNCIAGVQFHQQKIENQYSHRNSENEFCLAEFIEISICFQHF